MTIGTAYGMYLNNYIPGTSYVNGAASTAPDSMSAARPDSDKAAGTAASQAVNPNGKTPAEKADPDEKKKAGHPLLIVRPVSIANIRMAPMKMYPLKPLPTFPRRQPVPESAPMKASM